MTSMPALDHRPEVEAALRRLIARAEAPRGLVVEPERLAKLRTAADRVDAQLLGDGDLVLTIALAGCTGAGKSTLINALAGASIAEAAERRPTTMRTRVYHHRSLTAGGLPAELAAQASPSGPRPPGITPQGPGRHPGPRHLRHREPRAPPGPC